MWVLRPTFKQISSFGIYLRRSVSIEWSRLTVGEEVAAFVEDAAQDLGDGEPSRREASETD